MIRTFFLILLFPFLSHAQRFDAGIQIGAIASQLSGDQASGFDKPGFELGAMVHTPVSGKLDAGLQLMYVMKGSRKTQNPDIGDYTFYRCRLNYIQMPVMIEYHLNRKISFGMETGLAALLSAEEEDQYGTIEGRKQFSKLEWMIAVSMNYMLFENFQLILGTENSVLPVRKYDGSELYRLDRDQFNSLVRFAIRIKLSPKRAE